MAIDFDDIAKTIGYSSASSMFNDMYVEKQMGLLDISDVLGVNRNTIKRQILLAGIKLKSRGGSHPSGPRLNKVLESIPMSRIVRAKISRLAGQLDLAPSTIYEYLRRKGMQKKGPKKNAHPSYSRKRGAHTHRPAVEQMADTVIEALSTGQLEAVLEEQKDEDSSED